MVKSKGKPTISSPQKQDTPNATINKGVGKTNGNSNGTSENISGPDSRMKLNGNNGSHKDIVDTDTGKKNKPKAPPKPNKKPERKFKPSPIEIMDRESEGAQERLLDNVDIDVFDVDHHSDQDSTKLFPNRNHSNHPLNVQVQRTPIIVNSRSSTPQPQLHQQHQQPPPHGYLFTPTSTLPRGSPSPILNPNQNQIIYHGPRSTIGSRSSSVISGGTLPLPNTKRIPPNLIGSGTYGRTGTGPGPGSVHSQHPTDYSINTMNGHGNGDGVIYALNSNGTLTPLRRNVGGMTLPKPYPTRYLDQTNTMTPTPTNNNGRTPTTGFNETAVALNQQRLTHNLQIQAGNGQSAKLHPQQHVQQQQILVAPGTGSSRAHAAEYQRLHRVGLIRAKARTDSYKVIAFICGLFAAILLVMGLASSEWLLATGYRQGLFVYCVGKNETETNVPFVSRPEQATEGCHRIDLNVQAYTLVAAAFCVVALLVDVFATLLTVLGLRCRDPNKKYKYYRIAVYVMALALVAVLVALVVYPVCFARIMEGSKRPFWEFGWAYGVGWGASIFLFGGVILLLCDKESEEIYYKERTIVQYADTNSKA